MPVPAGEIQSAGLRTETSAAAPPAENAAHVALSADTDAQRAVHENLKFNAGVFGDALYLFEGQLPPDDRPAESELLSRVDSGGAVQRHLRGGMARKLRADPLRYFSRAEILDYKSVHAAFRSAFHTLREFFGLAVVHQRVQRGVDFHPALVAFGAGCFKLLNRKIFGIFACRKFR